MRRSTRTPHVLRTFVLLLTAIAAFSCIDGPLEPIMPYTDVSISIPLADREWTIDEAEFESPAQKNPDGTISVSDQESFDPIGLDSLSIQPEYAWDRAQVGQFEADSLPPTAYSVQASDLGIPAQTYPVLPAGSASLPPINLDVSHVLDFVSILGGNLYLTVQNTLPVAVSFPNGIRLRNNSTIPTDTSELGIFAFGSPVQPGETRLTAINLAGKTARGSLTTGALDVQTAAGTNVTVQSGDGLVLTFWSTLLYADSAQAVIPSQHIFTVADSSFVVDDSVVVQEALFRSGRLVVAVTNQMDVAVGAFIRLNDLTSTVTGNSVVFNVVIPRKDSLIVPIAMDTVRVLATPSALGTRLTFSLGISTITSGGTKALLTDNDFVKAELRPQGSVRVRSLTGKITPYTLNVNTSYATGFKSGELAEKFSGQVLPDSTRITISLPITGGFPAEYDLTFVAKNVARNIVDSIVIPPLTNGTRRIYPNSGQVPQIVMENFAPLNTLLSRFVPHLPDSFIVRGTLLLNPPDVFASSTLYTIADTSKVYPSLAVDIPLRLSIANGSFVSTEAERIDLDDDVSNSLKQATANVEVTNGIPLQYGARISMLGTIPGTSVRDTLVRIVPTAIIQAASVDAAGFTTGPRVTNLSVSLTAQDIQRLSSVDTVQVRLTSLSTTNAATVRFRTTDKIRARASTRIVYTINRPN